MTADEKVLIAGDFGLSALHYNAKEGTLTEEEVLCKLAEGSNRRITRVLF
ncbi:hypothetical protein KIPB_015664, partial [Kipferlia bialata]|eukprot:g15664.t1